MSTSGNYIRYYMFRGLINNYDDEYEKMELSEIDSNAYNCISELNKIEPHRDPNLSVDYFGISGDLEMIFNFKSTWMDRESDIGDYIDKVQTEVENLLNVIISEIEYIGLK